MFLRGQGILVVDAGGGTVDLSAYTRDPGLADNSFKECAPAQCKRYDIFPCTLANAPE